MILAKIAITIGILGGFALLTYYQIRKVQEIAIQPGGMTFYSSKVKMIICAVFCLLCVAGAITTTWLWITYLIFVCIGVGLVLLELAIACYCALSDKNLFVMQAMPLKEIRSIHGTEKGKGYQVEFDFNGVMFRQFFTVDGYEYIKQAKRNRKALSESK